MDDRLLKPLSSLIEEREQSAGGGRRAPNSMKAQSNRSTSSRHAPYEGRGPTAGGRAPDGECALKFLLPNALGGVLIGEGGSKIKKLQEVTGTQLYFTGSEMCYPGTRDRLLFMTGSIQAVQLAQGLIWELLGLCALHASEGTKCDWDPELALQNPSQSAPPIECTLSLPASQVGRLLGKGGVHMKAMNTNCDVRSRMSEYSQASETQERLITVAGTVNGCVQFTSMVLNKLMEEDDGMR